MLFCLLLFLNNFVTVLMYLSKYVKVAHFVFFFCVCFSLLYYTTIMLAFINAFTFISFG